MNKIPDEIIYYVQNILNGGFYGSVDYEGHLKEARDEAIEAIEMYKKIKRKIAKRKAEVKHISDWLEENNISIVPDRPISDSITTTARL